MLYDAALYLLVSFCFFFNDTATTEIYTLSLHDALPISGARARAGPHRPALRRPDEPGVLRTARPPRRRRAPEHRDRKSTRLNSSHANISYAVFCLKKKKTMTLNPMKLDQHEIMNRFLVN